MGSKADPKRVHASARALRKWGAILAVPLLLVALVVFPPGFAVLGTVLTIGLIEVQTVAFEAGAVGRIKRSTAWVTVWIFNIAFLTAAWFLVRAFF